MVAEREEHGLFTGITDFCRRMGEKELNKRAVENLIKCGAKDCLGLRRSQLLAV
jgi:DNA polymerase-3 subunit alpha